MAGTLCTNPKIFRDYKALVAAQFSETKVTVASDFVFGQTNKSEAFLKKFLLGKVPALETADSKFPAESNAIAYYVAYEQLRGKTAHENAEMLSFLFLADNELLPAVHAWFFPMIGIIQFQKNNVERAKQHLKAALNARMVDSGRHRCICHSAERLRQCHGSIVPCSVRKHHPLVYNGPEPAAV